jgi:hypothetical protein
MTIQRARRSNKVKQEVNRLQIQIKTSLSSFCFRKQKNLLGNTLLPRYATTLKRISSKLGAFGQKQSQTLSLLSAPACSSGFPGTRHRWKISGCEAFTLHFNIPLVAASCAAQIKGESMLLMFHDIFDVFLQQPSANSLVCRRAWSIHTFLRAWDSRKLPLCWNFPPKLDKPLPPVFSFLGYTTLFEEGNKGLDSLLRPPGPKRNLLNVIWLAIFNQQHCPVPPLCDLAAQML